MHIEKFQIHRLKIHFFVSRLICCSLLADMYSCLYNYLLTYLITYTFIRFLSDLPKWTFDWRPRKLSWIINFKKILLHEKQFDGFSHCVIGERCHKTTATRIALEASSIAFFFLSLFKPKGRTEKFVKLVCARARVRAERGGPAAWSAQFGQIHNKNPPKMKFKIFVKMTDHIYACNDLTNFEC